MVMKAVIFDMDGVLVDSYLPHFESWRQVAHEEGVTFTERDFARTFGHTTRDIIRALWKLDEPTDEHVRAIDDRKEARYRKLVSARCPVMDGALDLIASLRDARFKVAVGSSGPPENVALVVERMGGPALFDAIVHGRDVHRGKPDPGIFLLAAERAGVHPHHSLVVEDARAGIEAAARAGMACVALRSTGPFQQDFGDLRISAMVDSLRELSPAWLGALIDEYAAGRNE